MAYHSLRKVKYVHYLVFSLILTSVFSLHLLTLLNYPAPFADEAWGASRAWGYLKTGIVFGELDAGVIDRFEGYWTFLPRLHTIIQSYGMRFFGSPSLLGIRIISLATGLFLLLTIFAIGSYFGGKLLGFLSVLVTSLSRSFFISAHLARPDIMASAFGFAAIAIVLHNRRSLFMLSFLAGLFTGLAFEIHPNSTIFLPVIAIIYFLRYRIKMFATPGFWGFCSGVVAGLFYYAATHIIPYPQSFLKFNQIFFGPTHTPPILSFNLQIIYSAFFSALYTIISGYPFAFPVIAVAFFLLYNQNNCETNLLLTIILVLFSGFILLVRNKIFYYAILITPALDILIAYSILILFQQPRKRSLTSFSLNLLVGILITLTLILNITDLRYDSWKVYQGVQKKINQVVKQDDVIMGDQLFWFGLFDNKYYSWEELIYFQRYKTGSNLEDSFKEFSPDIFIIDRQVNNFILDNESGPSYIQNLRLPRNELENILTKYGKLETKFNNTIYGDIEVYRFNWDIER